MRWNNLPEIAPAAGVLASFPPLYMRRAQDKSLEVMRRLAKSDKALAEKGIEEAKELKL